LRTIKNRKGRLVLPFFQLIITVVLVFSFTKTTYAQQTIVKGRVTDAVSGEGMPFVTIYFKGTTVGTNTNFDGFYSMKADGVFDSIVASYVGYKTKVKPVKAGTSQEINFQLDPDLVSLQEVVVVPGENAAWPIMRAVMRNKNKHDKRNLKAYEYESYNKIEIDIDNISDNLRKRKLYKKIAQVLDSVDRIAGEDGKPILPIFISETISNVYFKNNPDKKKEKIIKTKLTGVGIQDGTLVAQLVGSSFQEYNFYKNSLTIVEKEFISPLADGWKMYYDYRLLDSLYLGDDYCYKIDVKPKRAQDLAFYGTIWITQKDYALKQIDATITQNANLNFIEKIKVQQELEPTEADAWVPVKSRIVIDIAEPSKELVGMIAKFYSSNKNIVVNQPKEDKFYDAPIEVSEDALITEPNYWNEHRHDSLSPTEKNVYIMIDSLRNVPVVRSYIEIANIVINGYKRVGKIDVGPYIFTYNYNNVEGNRFRLGFKTNINFSDKWIFRGYGAYGTLDQKFKYSGSVDYIFSRKPWTMAGIRHYKDLEQVGLMTEEIYDNTLFYTSSRWGTLYRPFLLQENRAYFQTEVFKGYTQKIALRTREYKPLFPFEYLTNPPEDTVSRNKNFETTELVFEGRLTRNEIFIQNDNERISLGTGNWPILTVRYIMGLKGFAGSDFSYHKMNMTITQNLRLGYFGTSSYNFNVGYIPSRVPYQLLQVHLGNETFFLNSMSFNLMNYFEFVSDTYGSFNYTHRFEGLFFNRIPLVKKAKLRFLVTGNFLYGTIRKENQNLIPPTDINGVAIERFGSLDKNVPYIELGYGIENIFKFLRIDAIHRMNYLDKPDVKRFGVKFSAQFRL
jgi:hypothetical protein